MMKDYQNYGQRSTGTLQGDYTLRQSTGSDGFSLNSGRRHYNQSNGLQPKDPNRDSKIMEIRKKYEETPVKTLTTTRTPPTKPDTHQEEVFRRLSDLKKELTTIPNWEKYARSIFFDENRENSYEPSETPDHSKKGYFNMETISTQKSTSKPVNESNYVLKNSNMNFEIKQTSSIHQSEERNLKKPDRKAYINEFEISQKRKSYVQQAEKFDGYEKKQTASKVDQRISQLESRIKEFERKKKNLNIDFSPSPVETKMYHNRSTSQLAKYDNFSVGNRSYIAQDKTPQKSDLSRPPKYRKNSSSSKKKVSCIVDGTPIHNIDSQMVSPTFAGIRESSIYDDNQKMNKWIPTHSQQLYKEEKQSFSKLSNTHQKYQLHRDQSDHQFKDYNKKTNSDKFAYNCERERKTEEGIENRKKKISSYDYKSKKMAIEGLVSAISEQAKLDDSFRNSKMWFKNYKNDKKWDRLKSVLQIEGIQMEIEELKDQFELSELEDNPFYSVGSESNDLESVGKDFAKSQKYWRKYLWKKAKKRALLEDGFKIEMIDLDHKGYIVLEDVVRFLNMQTGTFFRNRDIYTTFKRIGGGDERISFEKFLSVFSE